MTFLISIILFSVVGIGAGAVVFNHRRKMRLIELRHERDITRSLEKALDND